MSSSQTPPAGHTRAPLGIPKLIYLARILHLCFFPLATVLVGAYALLRVPQAQEALLAFSDETGARDHFASQAVSFEIAYVLWMLAAWYVARLLLGKRFEPDLVGTCDSPPFARGVAKHLPRFLALVAGLPIAFYLVKEPALRTLGVVSIVICGVVFTGLVYRRELGSRRGQHWVTNWRQRGSEDLERFDFLSRGAWIFIGVLFAVAFGLWLILPIWMSPFARWVGAPALLLFALMAWTVFGGFILTYLPKSFHIPSLTWIAAVAVFVVWHWDENHLVAPPVPGIHNGPRAELGQAFVDWLHRRPNRDAPVIFVASAGGASRAAYWTTSALGKLEDEARADPKNPRVFADNIFVISGVSGGSLGAASFVTTLDLLRKAPTDKCLKVRDVGNRFTSLDHLSTVVGLMLFPDLLQRFLPMPVAAWDRSRGLEEVWARDWNDLLQACGGNAATQPNPWNHEFVALYPVSGQKDPLPALALTSTALAAGQAVMQTTFILRRPDTFDILDAELATQSLTLAQAVHNSARFPYISPGGVVKLAQGNTIWDRLGDGGYVEASGALTLQQIIAELAAKQLIRARGAPPDNDSITWDQVRILIVDNTPTNGMSYLCTEPKPGGAPGERSEQRQNVPATGEEPLPPGPDFLVPVVGAFSTRGGRAVSAIVDLRSMVGGCNPQFAEIRLPKGSEQPAMDWMLNSASRKRMDATLDEPMPAGTAKDYMLSQQRLQENLGIVRTWFAPR